MCQGTLKGLDRTTKRRWAVRRLASLKAGYFLQKNSRYPNGSLPCALLGMGDRDGSLKAIHYLLCAAKDLMVPKEYNQLHEEMQKFVNEVGFLPKTLILLQFCSPGS